MQEVRGGDLMRVLGFVAGKQRQEGSERNGQFECHIPVLSSRAYFTMFRNLRASSRICPSFLLGRASDGINSVPMPTAVAPAMKKFTAVVWLTPPEAIKRTFGKGTF